MTTLESQSDFDDFTRVLASHPEFTVLRIKHEVQTLKAGETPLYYEAHVKFDGGYRPDLRGASRDLFRLLPDRWYVTQRRQPFVDPNLFGKVPFSVDAFKESVHLIAEPYVLNRRIDGVEAEWVLTDTNQDLDKGWL
jgi:hypothetical protein